MHSNMRSRVKSLGLCLLVAVLAAPVFVTGCRTENATVYNEQQPSDYAQWERNTHRQHEDYNKRSPEDQKEYRDWQQNHRGQH